MESQSEMMKKTIDDLRSQAMEDKMTEYFKDDGISMPEWCEKSAIEVYKDIVEIYKALWSVNPTLDDINHYSEKEFRLCPTGNIIYEDDYDYNTECCDCPSCELKKEKDEEEENKPRYSVWIELEDHEILNEKDFELSEEGKVFAQKYYESLIENWNEKYNCVMFMEYNDTESGYTVSERWKNEEEEELVEE